MRFLYSALIFLASLASLLGFLLFPPVVVLAMAQRRGTCSKLPVVLGFCIAVVCHCGLEYEANTFFRDDSRPMMALYRWTSLGTWLVRRDDFWYDAAERFACDTPMTFLLTHGASPTEGLRQILRQLSLYGNTHATPFVPPLLSSGADPNVLIFGQSALALTIDRGKFDLATLLLKAGATPSPATDQWGKTLLHHSAAAGAEPEFLLLLADKMGSGSWNLLDARGRAPIHELSTVSQLTLLASMPETLLTTGRDGGTLIHYAIEQGRERLIPRLLELGFTWQTPDSNGCTPLAWAPTMESFRRLRPHAISAEPIPQPALSRLWQTALQKGDVEFTQALLLEGASPHTPLPDGHSPLHIVVSSPRAHLLLPLLASAGANLEALNGKQETPLIRALLDRNATAARVLLDLGANARIRHPDHRTTLQLAQEALDAVKRIPRNLSMRGFQEEWDACRPWEAIINRLERATVLAESELSGDEFRVPTLSQPVQPSKTSETRPPPAKRDQLCPTCSGSGNCPACHGRGEVTDYTNLKWKKCSTCRGNRRCRTCNGKGRVTR